MVAKGTNDTKTAYGKIARFLADKIAKSDKEHWTPWIITDAKEISGNTGLREEVVRTYLLKIERELMDKGMALVRIYGTYTVIKLGPEETR